MHRTFCSPITIFAFSLGILCNVTTLTGNDDPEHVKLLKETIADEAKIISKAAHPLGKFKELTFDKYDAKGSTHILTFTVRWVGKENKKKKEFTTRLKFATKFDGDEVHEMEIAVINDTSPSKPFKGANIAASVFRAQLKKRMSDFNDDEELFKKLKTMDADGLLALWIMYSHKKRLAAR